VKTIILGGHGQLGTALEQHARSEVEAWNRDEADLSEIDAVFSRLESSPPAVLINCAAYNFVDRAETEPDQAMWMNADVPGKLAEWCAIRGVTFVHFSTDYVFGGDTRRTTPYRETDAALPLSVYGRSKLSGEENVLATCERSFVIRTCGLYGKSRSAGKGNFVQTMLKLSESRHELRVVDDQHCTPTFTEDLAQATWALLSTEDYGLFHITNSGSVTWCELAREIFAIANRPITVSPISSEEFGAAAERPRYSVLDCSRFFRITQHSLPDWKSAVHRYLNQRPELENSKYFTD